MVLSAGVVGQPPLVCARDRAGGQAHLPDGSKAIVPRVALPAGGTVNPCTETRSAQRLGLKTRCGPGVSLRLTQHAFLRSYKPGNRETGGIILIERVQQICTVPGQVLITEGR